MIGAIDAADDLGSVKAAAKQSFLLAETAKRDLITAMDTLSKLLLALAVMNGAVAIGAFGALRRSSNQSLHTDALKDARP